MQANYHTHTFRCHHAYGTEREYIEKAIEAGMTILGFSDHVPYPFPNGYYSDFRMRMSEVEEYIGTLASLRKEYKNDIQILIGFEAEYYPDFFNKLLEQLNPYNYDYLILGQHFLENEISGIYSGFSTDKEEILKKYVDQTIEGMKTGKFSYLAHPDLINYKGSLEIYRQHMTRLCVSAKEMDMPLEINFLGLSEHRQYPCDKFFEIASKLGNQVIFGCDAHNPSAINDPSTVAIGEAFVKKFGLTVIECLKLKNPKL